ncbi:helix-turn-helix domain-containing protein [Haladaptatus pallidirubidus]|uniref:Helix-turn-helix domain-containing protein n=1 Tax=Haladaptatus pallidirubidus TaxID=1008152 RepID=A0AAV3UHQ4_9EURY|nr:helix-turn-helix domain-containing protein [Haladaptatus pallidirubidus]
MPTIQLKINAAASDDCLATLSTEFPDEEFKILASHTTADGLLGIVEVRMSDGDTLVRQFDESPEVCSSEVIHADERMVLIQYVIPIPDSYRVVRTSGVLVRFPVVMRDGWLFVERTASHERLAQYTDELEAVDMVYQILSLTQSYDPIELLTDRQQEFMTEAGARGYYDTHRRCTLTELAESFAVTKSAASRILHRAEERIIKDALSDSMML